MNTENRKDNDFDHMKEALLVSKKTLDEREVPIACIIVYKNSVVIARGSNDVNRTKNATRHAEILAIEQVRRYCITERLEEDRVFKDSTLYVTTEPCIMCAAALRLVGLTNIVYGCGNQRFGGCGSTLDVHTRKVKDKNDAKCPDSKKFKLDEIEGGCMTSLGEILQCKSGVMADEAIDLLKLFYAGENPNAPNPKDKSSRKEALKKTNTD